LNFLICLLISVSQAGFLKMRGEPSVSLSQTGNNLFLKGEYSIYNEGDETAWQVFPVLGMDQFRWLGPAQNISPGQSYTWKVNTPISEAELCNQVSDRCLVELPLRGNFSVRVEKHYQDQNGFKFVVPDVFFIPLQPKTFSTVHLTLEINSEQSGVYEGRYSIENPHAENLRLSVSPLLPEEVRLITPLVPIEIQGGGKVQGSFQFKNERGLPGSQYVAILIADWSQGGERNSQIASSVFYVPKLLDSGKWSFKFLFWFWFSLTLSLGLIGMWAYWIRPLRKISSR